MITIINKYLDENNRLEGLKLILKNDNRNTVERFDATPLLEPADYDYDTVIELLKQANCTVLAPIEAAAIELYKKPHGEPIDITPEEFDYAVKNGLTLRQIIELHNLYQTIKHYEVKI